MQDELKLRLALAAVSPAKAQEKEEDLEQECVVLQQQLAELASQVNRDELIVYRHAQYRHCSVQLTLLQNPVFAGVAKGAFLA